MTSHSEVRDPCPDPGTAGLQRQVWALAEQRDQLFRDLQDLKPSKDLARIAEVLGCGPGSGVDVIIPAIEALLAARRSLEDETARQRATIQKMETELAMGPVDGDTEAEALVVALETGGDS